MTAPAETGASFAELEARRRQLERRQTWYQRGAIAMAGAAALIGFSEQTKWAESPTVSNVAIGSSLAVMSGFCALGARNDKRLEAAAFAVATIDLATSGDLVRMDRDFTELTAAEQPPHSDLE